MKRKLSKSAIFCFSLALVFAVLDAAAVRDLAVFISDTETADGVVTDYHQVSSGTRGGTQYQYNISFQASDGRKYLTYTRSGSHEKGDILKVRYDRSDPANAYASAFDLWVFVIIWSIGLAISLLAARARMSASKENG